MHSLHSLHSLHTTWEQEECSRDPIVIAAIVLVVARGLPTLARDVLHQLTTDKLISIKASKARNIKLQRLVRYDYSIVSVW